ncbi:sensor histidine kinase [Glycomyces tritici]|uniref:histidine kinase n=1 Tax=Glycomyces tritici TaxID=2665176 RepID=A0ABT7YTR5_9ACTN|nr:histidine kinase [Glycomyces tritici]MDN3242037.1 histidine kinase [Glycomyces tritici]
MRNGALLAVIALAGLVDGVATFAVPMSRQALLVLVAAAAYLHGWRLTVRYGWWILGAVAALGTLLGIATERDPFTTLLTFGSFVVLPWLIGRFRRQQADLIAAAADRLTRLERERELVAGRARAQERARIATDMHDSLGHELALIALRAGALELSPDLPDGNREAAAALRRNAVDATDRLRQTIGILRDGPAPEAPLDESLEALVGRAAEAGMRVTLATDAVPLPPLAAKTVHRVVQESLTNAARYAPGAEVRVAVSVADAIATVSVRNSGRHAAVPSGKGSGLVGLEQRVRLLDGAFSAGPVEDGFEVRAEVPLENMKIDATWQGNR